MLLQLRQFSSQSVVAVKDASASCNLGTVIKLAGTDGITNNPEGVMWKNPKSTKHTHEK